MKKRILCLVLIAGFLVSGCSTTEEPYTPAIPARISSDVRHCSGTPLANTPYFVTAAHCMEGRQLNVYYDKLKFDVVRFVVHPEFQDNASPWDVQHDVAVVVVDGVFPSGPYSADLVGEGSEPELRADGWFWEGGINYKQGCLDFRSSIKATEDSILLSNCGIKDGGSGAGLLSGESPRMLEGVLATADAFNIKNRFAPPTSILEVLELAKT